MKKGLKLLIVFVAMFLVVGKVSALSNCFNYSTRADCKNSKKDKIACIWVDKDTGRISDKDSNGYCNVDNLQYIVCGRTVDIPRKIPEITSFIFSFLQIGVAVLLVVIGMIQLVKAMVAGKEDEMKKAKSMLIKKLIYAVLVFFVAAIVKLVISLAADNKTEMSDIETCMDCILNNNCSGNAYYKETIAGVDYCKFISSGTSDKCGTLLGVTDDPE